MMARYIEINKLPGVGTCIVSFDEVHGFIHRELKEMNPGQSMRLTVVEMDEAKFSAMEDFAGWKS